MSKTNNINSKLLEFKCIPEICTYNSENYKVYGVNIDVEAYPDLKINKYGNVTLTGDIQTLGIGIAYSVKAFEESTKYGFSYKIQNIRREKPTDLQSSKAFLYEIITQNQADTLLSIYPDLVDRVIQNRLDDIDLSKTYNIKEYTFNIIKEKIIENFALVDLCDRFAGIFNISILKRLYDKYPSLQQIEKKLKEDPYACLCGLSRIGFRSADSLILELDKASQEKIKKGEKPIIDFGYDVQTSPQREKACVMYLLEENENNGHTKMDIREIKSQSERLTPACSEHFVDVIKNDKDVYYDKSTLSLALTKTYETEKYIADRLLEGLNIKTVWDIDCSQYKQDDNGMELTDEQLSALECLCNNNIMVLNGNGGSGKSSSTNAAIKMLQDNDKTFRLFAPTGKASVVLSDFTKQKATTIHRGLGFKPPNEWGYDETFKLDCDVLIIDEFSMVDIFLFKRVLEALDLYRTKLLLIGDDFQISSVGAGNVLYDLLHTTAIPRVTLTRIFRYGSGGIMTVATNIRLNNKFIENNECEIQMYGEDKSYNIIPILQEKIISHLKLLYKKLLERGNKPSDILILSCYNKGEYGTVEINKQIQPIANDIKSKNKIIFGETTFYQNDLVIQGVNNYTADIYYEDVSFDIRPETTFIANGEIGYVEYIFQGCPVETG